ncbi:MAG: 2-nitropropane dioxygenase, partial [Betaproteobacteria bacterium HGW-Betaproteobacteria-16]
MPQAPDQDTLNIPLHRLAAASGLKTWRLAGRELLPVVQGGMGVGVSAGGLAGA